MGWDWFRVFGEHKWSSIYSPY